MKKVLLSLILTSTFSFASSAATKDDIKDLIHHLDKRFEQVDKRFEQMQKNMDKRFEQVDKRFEQVDKRFEQVDKRFEDQMGFLNLLGYGILAMIGFMFWDRRTMLEKSKSETKKDLESDFDNKVDKEIVKHIIEALQELGKNNKEFNEILKKHHLSAN